MIKKLLITLLILFTLTGTSYAFLDDWTTYDKSMYAASWVIAVIDIGQTRYTYHHPELFQENNRVITKWFNSDDKATAYLIGCNLLIGFMADKLSPQWRSFVLTVNTVSKSVVVFKNNSIHVKWEW